MNISTLDAISPVDGRYRNTSERLSAYFSEGSLIKYRTRIECEYFIALSEIPLPQLAKVTADQLSSIRNIYLSFTASDAEQIKEIEKKTNHDVKSVEYFLKEKFKGIGLDHFREYIHFGLTSQDINNTAIPLSLKEAWQSVLLPELLAMIDQLVDLAEQWKNVSMLARTHGQPASPTSLGKEMFVFVDRLNAQLKLLRGVPFSAKFGGATGNFNAHHVAYPNIDWIEFGNHFVNQILGLHRSRYTTQIEHYDNLGAFCDNLKRINSILIDLNRDIWTYISMDYFKQKINKGEVGSSTMPHKVNPIDFENSEGNLGISNAVLKHLSEKLPISRLQRDLTDSTVTRNIGIPMAHFLIAIKSLQRGLGKLLLNEEALFNDLEKNWAVVSEAIQTILRREGISKPYEMLKELTRTHTRIDKKAVVDFIQSLNVSEEVKQELLAISPHNYRGVYEFGKGDVK